MQDLVKQERFELEVLERLNSKRLLNKIVFGGETMLRLCYGLNRFSVDLDFWITRRVERNKLFKDLKEALEQSYQVKDCVNKFYTMLFEIKSRDYPRSLKIEIRKETRKITAEKAIAYSRHSNIQVFLNTVSLNDMMKSKISAFLDRREIRDVFDMEFLFKRGIELDAPAAVLGRLLKGIDSLTKKDYAVKLGSLLEQNERQYYIRQNFKLLKGAIKDKIERLSSKK